MNQSSSKQQWEGDLCEIAPDSCWIDRATGEHVNATTNTRTKTHPISVKREHNFQRTSCACKQCTKCCKRQPGPLASGDFVRIQRHLQVTPEELKKKLWASPGALVKDAYGKVARIGTVTPRMFRGRCVFLDENDRCSIHPVAPFGCAFFDTHMNVWTAHPRSIWLVKDTLNPEYQKLRNELPYAQSYKPRSY